MRHTVLTTALAAGLIAAQQATAQRGASPGPLAAYTRIDTPLVALTHVRVIDGTNAPPKPDQTIVIRDGKIESIGPSGSARIPSGAQTIDLAERSVIPGLVMVHEHLYYPNGGGGDGHYDARFTRLYLPGRA